MAKIFANCRLCRREGAKLYLKSERCFTPKCPIERKGAVPPGQHGQRGSRRLSSYGQQLREKQKLKRIYGILEKQLGNYFHKAAKVRAATGTVLLQLLERRLDNVVFRLGLTPSRSVARQVVSHGHVLVNNRVVNIASFLVKRDDLITLDKTAVGIKEIKKALVDKERKVVAWLARKASVGKVVRWPEREEVDGDINESLVVEYYSR